jgi:hypothetical protein
LPDASGGNGLDPFLVGAPMAITLSMTYTEALFCALAAWALERNWWLVGLATMLGKGSVTETTTVAILLGSITLAVLGARRMPWSLAAYGIGVMSSSSARPGCRSPRPGSCSRRCSCS